MEEETCSIALSHDQPESLNEEKGNKTIIDYDSDEYLVPPIELVDYDGYLDRDLSYDSLQSLDAIPNDPEYSKEKEVLPDQRTFFPSLHQNDYLITYEESEHRLIMMGQVLAIFLSLALIPIFVSNLQIWTASTSVIILTPTPEEYAQNMPVPNVLLMGKINSGAMVVLRQMDWKKFEVIWQFKVPKSKVVETKLINGVGPLITLRDVGYSIFENQGDLFIIYNDGFKHTTVIHTKSNKNQIVPNSKLPIQMYYFNTLVRVGHLVWMFGGTSSYRYEDNGLSDPYLDEVEHPCSPTVDKSIANNKDTKTVIWSIKRNRWFDGPSIPFKECIHNACSVAINKTQVLILIGPQVDKHIDYSERNKTGCIHLLSFSFESDSWTSKNDCVINVGKRVDQLANLVADWTRTTSLSCESQFDKDGKMSVVVMARQHKFYRLEYPSIALTELQSPIDETTRVDNIILEVKSGASMFTLKNIVYIMVLVEPTRMELFLLDVSSNSFDKIQIVGNFTIDKYLSNYDSLMALPFWQ